MAMAGMDWERVGQEVTVVMVMGWVASATGEAWVVVVAREMGWEVTVAEKGVEVVVMAEGWWWGGRQ